MKEQLDRIEEALFSIEIRLKVQGLPWTRYNNPVGYAVVEKLGLNWSFAATIEDYGATNITEVLAIPDSAFKKIRGIGGVRIQKMRNDLRVMRKNRNWKG